MYEISRYQCAHRSQTVASDAPVSVTPAQRSISIPGPRCLCESLHVGVRPALHHPTVSHPCPMACTVTYLVHNTEQPANQTSLCLWYGVAGGALVG